MLGSMSIHEEFWGAEDLGEYLLFCDNCQELFGADQPYIEKWNGNIMCADCVETKTYEFILDYIGYDNIFDVLEKLGKLEVA